MSICRTNSESPRSEFLLNIDPLWEGKGERRPDSPFDNTVQAGIRKGEWKLITGHPGQPLTAGQYM